MVTESSRFQRGTNHENQPHFAMTRKITLISGLRTYCNKSILILDPYLNMKADLLVWQHIENKSWYPAKLRRIVKGAKNLKQERSWQYFISLSGLPQKLWVEHVRVSPQLTQKQPTSHSKFGCPELPCRHESLQDSHSYGPLFGGHIIGLGQ